MDKYSAIKVHRLNIAIAEAERFIAKARVVVDAIGEAGRLSEVEGKRTAAAKRASMDLTRALVDVRRSPYA